MIIVATMSLPAVDRPNVDRCNATRSCQYANTQFWLANSDRPQISGIFLSGSLIVTALPKAQKSSLWQEE